MRRLRWRLARWIAPEAIMVDSIPGDGAFVVQREGPSVVTYALTELDITINNKMDPGRFGTDDKAYAWGGSRELLFTGKGSR